MLWKFENSKKIFVKLSFSPNITGLQFTTYEISKRNSKKNASFECSEIPQSLPGKVYNEVISLN